jgi:hypothetical protein
LNKANREFIRHAKYPITHAVKVARAAAAMEESSESALTQVAKKK